MPYSDMDVVPDFLKRNKEALKMVIVLLGEDSAENERGGWIAPCRS